MFRYSTYSTYSTMVAALMLVGSMATASATQIDSEGNYLMDRSNGVAAGQRVHQSSELLMWAPPTAPRFTSTPVTRVDSEGNYWMDRSKGAEK
jgi:hypothetical protein